MKKHTKQHTGCQEWTAQIPEILDLPEEDEIRQAWERHAAECSSCREVFDLESSLHRQIMELPEPGPARISMRVMHQVRAKNKSALPFRLRDFGWGLAGSLAGIFLGFWLAGSFNPSSSYASPVADYEQILTYLDNDIDSYYTEYLIEEETSE